MATHPIAKVTAEEYLALDRAAEFPSEYLDGEMVAMSGGSTRHARIGVNLVGQMYVALKDAQCEVFGSDLRVRVSSRVYTYPDVSVVCGKPLLADQRQDILLNPTVIIEVLSPSTEHYDRGIKSHHYRGVDSLRDYILVAQDHVHVEQYTRGEARTWTLRDYESLDEAMRIASIGVSIPLAAIYDRIEFPAPAE
jgi:Uma2 family endonuclease